MKTNEFFEKIVYINPAGAFNEWVNARWECLKRGLSVVRVVADDPASQVLPPVAAFDAAELAELLSFYKVIRQASVDRLNRLLILGGRIKLATGFPEHAERVYNELRQGWDIGYLGWDEHEPLYTAPTDTVTQQVRWATGLFAVAINNSFYPLFLEDARIPTYTLQEHIRRLPLNTFVAVPPLISRAK